MISAESSMFLPIKPLPLTVRFVDLLFVPIMFGLGGLRRDGLQETHHWHCRRIDPAQLDPAMMVRVDGDERGPVTTNRVFPFPSFHAPIFGGWKNYVVLSVQESGGAWHVGWIHRQTPAHARARQHVNRLRITGEQVRVLKQSQGFVTDFFAVTSAGRQLLIQVSAHGRIGSSLHSHIRLL